MHSSFPGLRAAWARCDGRSRRETSRRLVSSMLGADAPIVSGPCVWCGGPHGRPRLPGTGFETSIAYAGDVAVVVVAPSALVTALGVDAASGERTDPACMEGVLPGSTVGEWVRVEAALKADGRGLRVDPATVRLEDRAGGWRARLPGRSGPILGEDLRRGPPGIAVSAAVVTAPAAGARGDRARG